MNFAAVYNMVAGNFDPNMLSNVKAWVNAAQHETAAYRPWSWRLASSTGVALVAGQQTYQLTGTSPVIPDFAGLHTLELELTASGARKTLRPMDPQEFYDLTAHSRVNGCPIVYTVGGGTAASTSSAVLSGGNQQLVLAPPPIATAGNGVNLFIRYWRNLSSVEMSADSDVPILPVGDHMILVELANYYGYTTLGLPQQAQAWGQAAAQRLERMVTADELVTPPRGTDRLTFAAPPTQQQQGHVANPRLPLPVPQT